MHRCFTHTLLRKFFLMIYMGIIFQGTEVMRLPLLVTHYISHLSKDPSTTLYSFIEMHYFSPTVVDEDYEEDQKLPFKHHQDGISISHVDFCTPPQAAKKIPVVILSKHSSKGNYIYLNFYCHSFWDEIFRPPSA